ncbi:MAG: hypothetical protein WC884_00175 [Candidatus Paceibacterota bacterium]
MPDDQEITPNSPTSFDSTQDLSESPMAYAPIPPIDSEPAEVPSEALESSPNDFPVKSNDIPPSNSIPLEPANTQASSASNGTGPQIPPDFASLSSKTSDEQSKATTGKQKDLWKRFLDKVQIGKRKKLDRILALFAKQTKVTNDEVEKYLHVSDATTTRYLSQLEKEGKIIQTGKTGHSVFYSKI